MTKSAVILLKRERFMHMQDRAAFLDRQSLGAVIFSTMLTITLVASIYIGFIAHQVIHAIRQQAPRPCHRA